MRFLKLKPHLSEEEIKQITFSQKSVRDFQDWQIIYLVQKNKNLKAQGIADILGVNVYKIYNKIELYNKFGKEWKSNKNRGGRRKETSYLSLDDERILMQDLKEKALNGSILSATGIRHEIELKVGHRVSDDYIWDLFKRQGWSKKSLIFKHPGTNSDMPANSKKNLRKVWMP